MRSSFEKWYGELMWELRLRLGIFFIPFRGNLQKSPRSEDEEWMVLWRSQQERNSNLAASVLVPVARGGKPGWCTWRMLKEGPTFEPLFFRAPFLSFPSLLQASQPLTCLPTGPRSTGPGRGHPRDRPRRPPRCPPARRTHGRREQTWFQTLFVCLFYYYYS